VQLDWASADLDEAHGRTVGVVPDGNARDNYATPVPDVELLPVDDAVAHALLANEDIAVPLAAGFPHDDTFDGLRLRTPDARMYIALAEGLAIGDCGTHGWVDERGSVEIGYGLAEEWRGRGYGTATVRALIEALRAEPDARELTAGVEIANAPSWRLLERLGFTLREATETTRSYVLSLEDRSLPVPSLEA
jgi:GNAT superfamily N-acetyltransferase